MVDNVTKFPNSYGVNIITKDNGSLYKGEMRGDQPSGLGISSQVEDGKESWYLGEHEGESCEGFGAINSNNEIIYIGNVENSKPNGMGFQTLLNKWGQGQNIEYQGRFIDGALNGYCICSFPDGMKYYARYENFKPVGQGLVIIGKRVLKTHFINGVPSITAEIKDTSLAIKEVDKWEHLVSHDTGETNDQVAPVRKISHANGYFVGHTLHDRPHGIGLMYNNDGSITILSFINGEIDYSKKMMKYNNGQLIIVESFIDGFDDFKFRRVNPDGTIVTGEFHDKQSHIISETTRARIDAIHRL